MKIFCYLFLVFLSCSTHVVKDKPIDSQNRPLLTGWNDEDTYSVVVQCENELIAIDKAKHIILKNIVDVRLKNQSPYTDISKIKLEFDFPLKSGKIISREKINGEIYFVFQIYGKGLKNKFGRK